MKKLVIAALLLVFAMSASAQEVTAEKSDRLFQVALLQSLNKPLNDALKTDQREFTYSDIRGTVVALYCPDYMDGLNTSGWHLHFISEGRQKGGHVLDLKVQDGTLELDIISEFAMVVPDRESFNVKSLATDMKKEIEQV